MQHRIRIKIEVLNKEKGVKTRKIIKIYTLQGSSGGSCEGGAVLRGRLLEPKMAVGPERLSTTCWYRQMSASRARQFLMIYLHRTTYSPKQKWWEDHHLITTKDRMKLPRRWDHGIWKWRVTKTSPLVQTAEDALHERAKQFRRQLAGTQDSGDGKKSNTNWKMNASSQTITENGSSTISTVDSQVVASGASARRYSGWTIVPIDVRNKMVNTNI